MANKRLTPPKMSFSSRKKYPQAPENIDQRVMVVGVEDLGIVHQKEFTTKTGYKIDERDLPMVKVVMETNMVFSSDDEKLREFNGDPFLIFSRENNFYGSEDYKKTSLVQLIESFEKRDLEGSEKWGDPDEQYDLFDLVGKTAKGTPKHNKGGYAYIPRNTFRFDVDESGNPGEVWEQKATWPPKRKHKDTSFKFGANKEEKEENKEVDKKDSDEGLFDEE